MQEYDVSQLRKGVIELALLLLIKKQSSYGYELVQRLSTALGAVIGESTVYPILSRLNKSGVLEKFSQPSDAGPSRWYYRLSPTGQDYTTSMFLEWKNLDTAIAELATDIAQQE